MGRECRSRWAGQGHDNTASAGPVRRGGAAEQLGCQYKQQCQAFQPHNRRSLRCSERVNRLRPGVGAFGELPSDAREQDNIGFRAVRSHIPSQKLHLYRRQ